MLNNLHKQYEQTEHERGIFQTQIDGRYGKAVLHFFNFMTDESLEYK